MFAGEAVAAFARSDTGLSMKRTLVLDVVGLTPACSSMRRIWSAGGARGMRPLDTVTPAVTTTVQSTFVTGALPREHGIVGNGWYFRDLAEIWLWRQSNHLVGGEKLWDARETARPVVHLRQAVLVVQHVRVGRFLGHAAPDVSRPTAASCPTSTRTRRNCATNCSASSGQFPLFRFWGPAADIESTRWIGRSALRVFERHRPTLTLVYLPHLDYNLQRFGPNYPASRATWRGGRGLRRTDRQRPSERARTIVVLSEYGITEVSQSDARQPGAAPGRLAARARRARPRTARSRRVRRLCGGGSPDRARVRGATRSWCGEVAQLLRSLPGVERVLDEAGKRALGLDHPRSGELVAICRRAQLVHVLPLPRRRPRAGLRAHRRYSPQAGLRPGRALRRPRNSGCRNCASQPAWRRR